MMEAFAAYIKTITALTVFSALVGLLLPEGKDRRYTELVLGILVLMAVLSPLLRLLHVAQEGALARPEWEWSER
nr:stage III sporulation protein AF [uncultured Anaerotignum sp.]